MPIITQGIKTKVYSVSELNQTCRMLLENQFSSIQIEAEISNLVCAASGHRYFKLKDERTQVQCAFFKTRAAYLSFTPENGQQVLATAKVSLYEPRGDYQLIIENLEPAGLGLLQQRYEALKKKLKQEGLFNQDRKQDIPYLPTRIGIISSEKAAALRDILVTLKRRFKAIPVILYPTDVQGATASQKIANAIDLANQRNECEVLIVARGGGSIEDLWAFNEETVAYAIADSDIPVISGIGHETDFTIADFCADVRAATPTAAAEAASPDGDDLFHTLEAFQQQLLFLITHLLKQKKQQLVNTQNRLRAPFHQINLYFQHIDKLVQSLSFLFHNQINNRQKKLHLLKSRLERQHLGDKLHRNKLRIAQLEQQLINFIEEKLQTTTMKFQRLCAVLHVTSPLATLERGYALAFTEKKHL